MRLSDFKIGQSFLLDGHKHFLCTDKGIRTITAIHVDPKANAVFFQGPPYLATEEVFNEADQKRCSLLSEVLSADSSILDNLPAIAKRVIRTERTEAEHGLYPYPRLFDFNRFTPKGEELMPYTAREHGAGWIIHCYNIKTRHFVDIEESALLAMPCEWDMAKAACQDG